MKLLVRLFQLLSFRRTRQLERNLERLMVSSANLAQSAASLAGAHINTRQVQPDAMFMAVLEDVTTNLETIDRYLSTGQAQQAKILLDALILVTKRTGTDG